MRSTAASRAFSWTDPGKGGAVRRQRLFARARLGGPDRGVRRLPAHARRRRSRPDRGLGLQPRWLLRGPRRVQGASSRRHDLPRRDLEPRRPMAGRRRGLGVSPSTSSGVLRPPVDGLCPQVRPARSRSTACSRTCAVRTFIVHGGHDVLGVQQARTTADYARDAGVDVTFELVPEEQNGGRALPARQSDARDGARRGLASRTVRDRRTGSARSVIDPERDLTTSLGRRAATGIWPAEAAGGLRLTTARTVGPPGAAAPVRTGEARSGRPSGASVSGCRRRGSNPRHADYDSAALTD